jgi:hypothetical protein
MHKFLFYNEFITFLYIFRALLCSSSINLFKTRICALSWSVTKTKNRVYATSVCVCVCVCVCVYQAFTNSWRPVFRAINFVPWCLIFVDPNWQPASCHSSSVRNSEMGPRFFLNLCTLSLYTVCNVLLSAHPYCYNTIFNSSSTRFTLLIWLSFMTTKPFPVT